MKNIFILSEKHKINFINRSITDSEGNTLCILTKKPCKVLQILVDNCGKQVSYESIIQYAWGNTDSLNPNQNVRDAIKFLRKYADGLLVPYITEVTGFGYVFNCDYPQPEEYALSPVDGLFPITKAESFQKPSNYIRRPEQSELIINVFSGKGQRIHAIVGERGLGKTSLAGCFAAEALERGRFKYVISESYSSSIRETVEKIGKSKSSDPFSDIVAKLSRLCELGETLILIDNYDNPDPSDELSFDCDDYRRLAETGCSILFTSSCDLGGCYLIDDSVTYLSRLAAPLLVSLYFSVKGNKKDEKEDVTRLIEDYLFSNTYLVVLCGELAKQGMTAIDIIASFESLETDETRNFSVQKDGKRQDERTLLEHYCRILEKNKTVNPDDGDKRREVHDVLSVLALMPIGGIAREDLEDLACDRKTRKSFRQIISRLERHNIVFGEEKIAIQPIVREYLLREIFLTGKYTCRYIGGVAHVLEIESYHHSLRYWLSVAEAAYRVISDEYILADACDRAKEYSEASDKIDEIPSMATLIASRLASCYSAVNIYGKAQEYGERALPSLLLLPQAQHQFLDKLTLATCFNAVGYAHLHALSGDKENNLRTAYDCIKKGEELALSMLDSEGKRARIVLSKLHGELAAYHLKQKDYSSALECHKKALAEREELVRGENDNPQYRRMLAFTYRGIGTDHFYLSKTEDKIRHLRLSYDYNLRSVEIFEELYGRERLETVTGINRLVGTGIELISASAPDTECLAEDFIFYLNGAFDFYASCTFALCGEIEDSLSKLIALKEIIPDGDPNADRLRFLSKKAVDTVLSLDSANEKCLDLCKML